MTRYGAGNSGQIPFVGHVVVDDVLTPPQGQPSLATNLAETLDLKELVTLEEPAISSMWGIAAIVERLERKGHWTNPERDDISEWNFDAGIPRRGWAIHERDDEQV